MSRTNFVPALTLLLSGLAQAANGPLPLTQVSVNGLPPVLFAVDIGAETTTLDANLASKAGVLATYQVEVTTATGPRLFAAGPADLSFGGFTTNGEVVLSTAGVAAKAVHAGVRGILGMNMLRSRPVVTLDYKSGSVLWAAHSSGVELKADLASGRVLVDCGIDGRPFRLVLDSGAVGGIVLFRKPAGWVHQSGALLTTAAGQQEVGMSVLPEVRVGRLRLRDVAAALAPAANPEEQGCDGLLPSSLFQRVTIDFQQSRVFLEGR